MLLAALMIVSMVVSLSMPAGAAAANYTHWAYVPFPPLIRAVTWMDNPVEVYVNNSACVPGPTDDHCPAKPEEEGMMINISTGYHYPPICLGRAPGCLMPAIQNWLVEVPTVSTSSRFTTCLQVYPAAPKRQRPSRTDHDDDGGFVEKKRGNVGKRKRDLTVTVSV
nr:endogenous retrovirus group K member 19 Env polyprotein-like [Macaca nemestrina]